MRVCDKNIPKYRLKTNYLNSDLYTMILLLFINNNDDLSKTVTCLPTCFATHHQIPYIYNFNILSIKYKTMRKKMK